MSALVEFAPSSSPELDSLLNQYRETLFIPSVLSESHRRLIYRPSQHSVLVNEPGVTVTLPNDEDLKLKPMKLSDRPIKKDALRQISQSLASTEDDIAWNNLFPFLTGMKQAHEPIAYKWLTKITRKANERGKHQVILRCIEQPNKTGMRLSIPGVTREILIGCHRRAAGAGFKGEEFLSAAKQADHVALLFEKDDHCAGKLKEGEQDMRKHVLPVGVLLEMAAAKAIHVNGGKDSDGKVASYVAKALAVSEVSGLEPTSSDPKIQKWNKERDAEKVRLAAQGHSLSNILILRHGLKLALEVEGAVPSTLQQSFDQRTKQLDDQIQSALSELRKAEDHKPRRALEMYDELNSL